MNNVRREKLEAISKKLSALVDDIDCINDEEQDYMDNMPENLQGSERYERSEEICDQLTEAMSLVEEAIDLIDEARE